MFLPLGVTPGRMRCAFKVLVLVLLTTRACRWARTRSKANAAIPVGHGMWQATVKAAGQSCKKVLAVSEVIMGCTPLNRWEKLVELLSGKGVACVPGEFRAVARKRHGGRGSLEAVKAE